MDINARLQEKHPQAQPGMVCYQTLEGRDAPCTHCPLQALADRKNHACLIRPRNQQNPILLEATKIRWNGEDACLVSGRSIPEAE